MMTRSTLGVSRNRNQPVLAVVAQFGEIKELGSYLIGMSSDVDTLKTIKNSDISDHFFCVTSGFFFQVLVTDVKV